MSKRTKGGLPKDQYFFNRAVDAANAGLSNKAEYFMNRYKQLMEQKLNDLQEELEETKEQLPKRRVYKARGPLPKKEWMFNFLDEQGHPTSGWNTVWAKTLAGARKALKEEYGDSNPGYDTLREVEKNRKDYEMHLSLFY